MDLRRLHYFVAIADHGGFTRAAHALHMEQPPLSQQIKALERDLGFPLFTRSRHGATLTDNGTALLEHARTALEAEHRFRDLARGLARGEQGHLRVGLAGAVAMLPLVPRAIRRFRDAWPKITITMEESNTPALCEALQERRIDLAIVRPPMPDHTLPILPLLDEPTLIALPTGHPLARSKSVKLEALAKDPFILFDRALGPGFHDAILSACHTAGFTPHVGQQAPQIAATVALVAAGLGVSIVPSCLDQIHAEGVAFRKIDGPAPAATLAIATRRENLSPLTRRLIETLRETRDQA